jgi:DNA-binding MarR family transcriptional regulator
MKDEFLIIPLELVKELSLIESAVLTQLAFLRRIYSKINASNEYIAKKLNRTPRNISTVINNLEKNGYIISNLKTKNNKSKRTILLTKKTLKLFDLDIVSKTDKKPLSGPLKEFLGID